MAHISIQESWIHCLLQDPEEETTKPTENMSAALTPYNQLDSPLTVKDWSDEKSALTLPCYTFITRASNVQ